MVGQDFDVFADFKKSFEKFVPPIPSLKEIKKDNISLELP